MKTYKLNNGLIIPSVGFGTYPQRETLPASVDAAYRVGYRMFDISDNYFNEEYLGDTLNKSCNKMKDTFIITKFSQPCRTNELERCFDESREKLGGRIDIYLLHWPYPYLWKKQWRKMEQLYQKGKCKGIGVCNFETDKLQELLSFCKVKPVINQIERHPLFQQNDIVEFCKKNNICIVGYSPTARQDKDLYENEIMKRIAERHEKTISQIIIRWAVQTDTIPIPGSKSIEHINENINVEGFELSYSELEKINSLECGKRIRFDPKKRFSKKEKMIFAIKSLKLR